MRQVIIQLLAAFLGSMGFSMVFGLRRRFLIVASLGGFLAWTVYLLVGLWLHVSFLSYLLAAAFSVLYAEALAHLLKSPATLFLTPAIIPLVPGSSLYFAMSMAVRGEMAQARSYGVATLQAALAIAAGMSFVFACRELRTKR